MQTGIASVHYTMTIAVILQLIFDMVGSIFLRHVIRNNTISYERICTNRTEIAEIKGHSSIFVSFGDIAAPSQISNIGELHTL